MSEAVLKTAAKGNPRYFAADGQISPWIGVVVLAVPLRALRGPQSLPGLPSASSPARAHCARKSAKEKVKIPHALPAPSERDQGEGALLPRSRAQNGSKFCQHNLL